MESIAADLGRGLNHARLYEAENRLVEHLKALDSAKSDFLTISHELRAPLSSIEGYIELLSEEEAGPVTPQQRQMLQTVDRSASRLRTLTDDVFRLAELESGAYATVTRPVNMRRGHRGRHRRRPPVGVGGQARPLGHGPTGRPGRCGGCQPA